ncbi:MAG: heme lyase NrfEFG subunit NrfE, partial [Gammaproteobacteria bacterium]|nr:heme lyase NrfEFG subunit NrfE [Gammaproteobacteria bacterium]
GPPYYNAVFNPIVAIMVVMMGIAPVIRWKKNKTGTFRKELGLVAVASIVFGIAFPFVYGGEFIGWVAIGMGLAFWLIVATLKNTKNTVTNGDGKIDLSRPNQSYWGMVVSHMGIAVGIIGVTMVSHYETQLDIRMDLGSKVELSGYEFVFDGMKDVHGPNFTAKQGQFRVFEDGKQITLLQPERRIYRVQTMGMTEAGIHSTITRDLFVALGDPLDNGAWAVRVYVKPFINLLWIAGALVAFGGFICMTDRRYRSKKTADDKQQAIDAQPVNV